jgi:hypothetical protein
MVEAVKVGGEIIDSEDHIVKFMGSNRLRISHIFENC